VLYSGFSFALVVFEGSKLALWLPLGTRPTRFDALAVFRVNPLWGGEL